MTKRQMITKLSKNAGISRKEASRILHRYNFDYSKAYLSVRIPDILNDISKKLEEIVEETARAFERLADNLAKLNLKGEEK